MADIDNLSQFLTDVAGAIKQKTGKEEKIPAANFDTEILSIETGIDTTSENPVTPETVLSGKEAFVNGEKIIGSMVDNQAIEITPSTDEQLIPEGYHNGQGKVIGDENLTPENIIKGKSIFGIEGNADVTEDLNEVITAQDEKLDNLERILKEKYAGKGDGSFMNIFVQEEEPGIKEGIWIQADREIKQIVTDEDVYIEGEWGKISDVPNGPASNYESGWSVCTNKKYIYLFGNSGRSSSANKRVFKYNIETDEYTELSNQPSDLSSMPDTYNNIKSCTNYAINDYIYLFNKGVGYKYNTLNDTYTKISNVPETPSHITMIKLLQINDYIYLLYDDKMYKYDTVNDNYEKINITFSLPYTLATAYVGGYIYLISESKLIKYDLIENKTTSANVTSGISGYSDNQPFTYVSGTNIYIFSNSSSDIRIVKYDTVKETFEEINRISTGDYPIGKTVYSGTFVDNKIYIFNFGTDKNRYYSFTSKEYDLNTLVISQGKYKTVGYEIKPFDNKLMKENLIYPFADAWFYSDHLETDLPTYYGNGTEWVKIKN